jgi:hypothetical protein
MEDAADSGIEPGCRDAGLDGFPFWLPWLLAASLAVVAVIFLMQRQALRDAVAWKNPAIGRLDSESSGVNSTLGSASWDVQITLLWPPRARVVPAMGAIALRAREANPSGALQVQGLSRLANGERYQLWLRDAEGDFFGLGAFNVDSEGRACVEFDLPNTKHRSVAPRFLVTIEHEAQAGRSRPGASANVSATTNVVLDSEFGERQ